MEQFLEHPDKLLSDAHEGVIAVVTRDGEPVFMAVPMGASLDSLSVRLELAVSLFDREQVSIGVASRIAGLSISETIDELGRRRIPVAAPGRPGGGAVIQSVAAWPRQPDGGRLVADDVSGIPAARSRRQRDARLEHSRLRAVGPECTLGQTAAASLPRRVHRAACAEEWKARLDRVALTSGISFLILN